MIPPDDQTPACAAEPEFTSVFPGVELERTDYYREEGLRAELSEEVIRRHQSERLERSSGFAATITSVLAEYLELGDLDGLTIASADGLVIAESSRLPNGEIMAAIGAVFEYVADRAQHAGIASEISEMTILGDRREMAVVRYFPGLGRRFFLMAYARRHCAYRRITSLVLRKCGDLLRSHFDSDS